MDTGLAPRRHRPLVIALLLATLMFGMALRLYDLDGESLWHDEIATAKKAELDLQSLLTLLARAEGKPGRAPLMFTITHFFIVLFGRSEFILRFQAMLFGSLSILLAYKVGEILWTKDEGLVVALLLALNAYHVRYSQEARHYALMVFLALLSLIFLLQALQKNQKRLWIGYVLCTSLSLYNHYFGFLLLGAEVIFGAWVIAQNSLSYRREDIRKSEGRAPGSQPTSAKQVVAFCVSLALVAVSYLPWLSTLWSVIATQVGSELGAVSLASLRLSLSFLWTVFTDYSSAYGAAILLWVVAFLLGLVASGYRKAVLVVLWIGMPFAFLFVIAPKHFFRPSRVRIVEHSSLEGVLSFSESRLAWGSCLPCRQCAARRHSCGRRQDLWRRTRRSLGGAVFAVLLGSLRDRGDAGVASWQRFLGRLAACAGRSWASLGGA